MILNVCSLKSKLTQNISYLQEWDQNNQIDKFSFTQRFIHYKTYTLGEQNRKPAQNNHIWLVVVL